MILESELDQAAETPIKEIAENFIKDHYEGITLDPQVKEKLVEAVIYGAFHALSTVLNGVPVIKDDVVIDRKLFSLDELIYEAGTHLGIDDLFEDIYIEEEDETFEDGEPDPEIILH